LQEARSGQLGSLLNTATLEGNLGSQERGQDIEQLLGLSQISQQGRQSDIAQLLELAQLSLPRVVQGTTGTKGSFGTGGGL